MNLVVDVETSEMPLFLTSLEVFIGPLAEELTFDSRSSTLIGGALFFSPLTDSSIESSIKILVLGAYFLSSLELTGVGRSWE